MLLILPSVGWSFSRTTRLFPKYPSSKMSTTFGHIPPATGTVTLKIGLEGKFHSKVWIAGKAQVDHKVQTPVCSRTRTQTYTFPASYIVSGRLDVRLDLYRGGTGYYLCKMQVITLSLSYTEDKTTKFPDLQFESISASRYSRIGYGSYIPVTFRIKNTGQATVPSGTWVGFHTFHSTKGIGGGQVKEALAPGQVSKNWVGTLKVPKLYAHSDSIRATVDVRHQITESNERNNSTTIYLSVSSFSGYSDADLRFASFKAPSTAKAGQTVPISFQIRNDKPKDASSFYVRIYHGTSQYRFQGTNQLIGTKSIYKLKGNTSSSVYTMNVKIPSNANGKQYIHFAVDADKNRVNEWNEVNNFQTAAIQIAGLSLPDLSVPSFSVASTNIKSGSQVKVSYRIQNSGPKGATTPFEVKFYISRNDTYDSSDTLVGHVKLASLQAGAYSPTTGLGSQTITIPLSHPSGTRYLLAFVDAGQAVKESSETNNTKAIKIWVSKPALSDPELSMSSWSTSSSILGQGSNISITFRVKNTKSRTTKAFDIAFYYGSSTSTSGLTLLGTHTLSGLGTGATSASIVKQFKLTTAVAYGTGYIHYFIDSKNVVKESIETNNRGYKSIQITGKPDLVAHTLTLQSSSAAPGKSVTVSYRMYNMGHTKAGPFTVRFYYSTNTTITTTDTYLNKELQLTGLGAKAYSPGTGNGVLSLSLPANVRAGVGYIGIIVDYAKKTDDSNWANNQKYAKITITSQKTTDLAAVKINCLPSVTKPGGRVSISYEIANKGTAEISSFVVKLYFSLNSFISTQDRLLKTLTLTSLKAGQTRKGIETVTLSSSYPVGTRYIGMVVDPSNSIRESSESNNSASVRIQLTSNTKVDYDKDGYTADKDCNDRNAKIHPGATEMCDGVDNNCNGKIDESLVRKCYSGKSGTAGKGVCREGTRSCLSGRWTSCRGEVVPSTEICDGKDNDCDGQVDTKACQAEKCSGGCEGTSGAEPKQEPANENTSDATERPNQQEKVDEPTIDAIQPDAGNSGPDVGHSDQGNGRAEGGSGLPERSKSDETKPKPDKIDTKGTGSTRDAGEARDRGEPVGVGCSQSKGDMRFPPVLILLLIFGLGWVHRKSRDLLKSI